MNKIIIGVNALLIAAVGFLFYKVNTLNGSSQEKQEIVEEAKTENKSEKEKPLEAVGNAPTGKIAFVNIDILNDKSLEVIDLIAESKRRKTSIFGY